MSSRRCAGARGLARWRGPALTVCTSLLCSMSAAVTWAGPRDRPINTPKSAAQASPTSAPAGVIAPLSPVSRPPRPALGLGDVLGAPTPADDARLPQATQQAAQQLSSVAPDDPQYATLLWRYGRLLQANGDSAKAQATFRQLIRAHPDSAWVAPAHVALADEHADRRAFTAAIKDYDRALTYTASRVYPYALYRRAWVDLLAGRANGARDGFAAARRAASADRQHARLRRHAERDYVRARAGSLTPERAYAELSAFDKPQVLRLMRVLGEIYLERDQANRALAVFRDLLTRAPRSGDRCVWQFHIARALSYATQRAPVLKAIEDLVQQYVTGASSERGTDSGESACAAYAQHATRELAYAWHEQYVRTQDPALVADVERVYQLYSDRFPDSPARPQVRYYLAELYWAAAGHASHTRTATALWERAAVVFTEVASSAGLPAARIKEAAYGAVLSWRNALSSARQPPGVGVGPTGAVPAKRDIPVREQRALAAYERYLGLMAATDPEVASVLYLQARTYWQYDHLDAALPILDRITRAHLAHDVAGYAVQLQLDALNRARRYDELERLVQRLSTERALLSTHPDLAETLARLQQHLGRKRAETLERAARESGDYRQYDACGAAYLSIHAAAPHADRGDELLYNAGVCFEHAASVSRAVSAYTLLLRDHRQSALARRARSRLGTLFARIGEHERAADHLETYARQFAGAKDAASALATAIRYRLSLGDEKRALPAVELYIKQYGRRRPERAAAMFWALGDMYRKSGQERALIAHMNQYVKHYSRVGGLDRVIRAHIAIGIALWTSSCPVAAVDGACIEVIERALPDRCGVERTVVPVSRKRKRVAAAMGALDTARKLFERSRPDTRVPGQGMEHRIRSLLLTRRVSAARFYRLESEYELLLAERLPSGIRAPRHGRWRASDLARIDAWYRALASRIDRLNARYATLAGEMSVAGAVEYGEATLSRSGDLERHLSSWAAYVAGQWPLASARNRLERRLRVVHVADICTRARSLTRPANAAIGRSGRVLADWSKRSHERRASASARYRVCLQLADSTNIRDAWTERCERALDEISPPGRFSVVREQYAAPTADTPIRTHRYDR